MELLRNFDPILLLLVIATLNEVVRELVEIPLRIGIPRIIFKTILLEGEKLEHALLSSSKWNHLSHVIPILWLHFLRVSIKMHAISIEQPKKDQ